MQLKILRLINPDVFIENKIYINKSILLTLVAVNDPFFCVWMCRHAAVDYVMSLQLE